MILGVLNQDGVDPDRARAAADEILARSEFDEPPRRLIDRIFDAVSDVFARVFSFVPSPPAAVGQVIGVMLLVGAVVAVIYLLVRLFTVGRPPRRRPDVTTSVVASEPVGFEGRSRVDWEELARALEAAGRWREAMRARYGALVSELVEQGVLRGGDSRTAGELRHEFDASHPNEADDFDTITDAFEDAWYGREEVDAADLEVVRSLADRVKAGVG